MKVALTVRDHLERAELVYGDRVGIVDEPDQPAPSLGGHDLPLGPRPGPGPGRRARRARRRQGERVAMVSQNAARLLTVVLRRQRRGAGSSCRSTSASRPTRCATSSSTPAPSVLLVDPELDEALAGVTAPHRFVIGAETDELLYRLDAEPRAVGARRGRHRHHQLHERHHRPAQGRAADAPQPVAQRRHVRLAGRGERPRRLPAHAADVPLQRLGHAVRRHRHGRHPGRAAQGRRRRDPAPGRGARRDPAVRRAGRRRHDPRRGGRRGTVRSRGAGRARIVVAGAPPPTRTIERVETELGWEFIQIYGLTETAPLLTMNRARAEWDDLVARRSGPRELGRAGAPALGIRLARRRRGRGPGPRQRRARGLLGPARRHDRRRARRRLVPHRRRRDHRRRAATSPSRTARRT